MRSNLRKAEPLRILFSDGKLFKIDDVYQSEDERVRSEDLADVDKRGGSKRDRKLSQRVIVWLRTCSHCIAPFLISDEGTVDLSRCSNQQLFSRHLLREVVCLRIVLF